MFFIELTRHTWRRIAILDNNGNVVVKYVYDAWGNHTVSGSNTALGNLNPFRYRSYFYDTETKLYYLKTRYYDPEVGRFINMDSVQYADPETVNGLNLYAYCGNNPVMNIDPEGNSLIGFLIGLGVSCLVGWGLSKIFGSDIASGIGSTVSGASAIYTGFCLLSFGPVGWIAGGALMLIGAGTLALGVNNIVAGATGTNYIQKWTGMSDGLYNGLDITLNVLSAVGTIAGNAYMYYANVSGTTTPGRTGKPLSRYSLLDKNGVRQYRFYNLHGEAWFDKDFRHTGALLNFPHYHGWVSGTRLTDHWNFLQLIKWIF